MILPILAAAHSLIGYPITLAKMRHQFEVMLAADDRDHDHRISRAEGDRLFGVAYSPTHVALTAANRAAFKRDFAEEFTREDENHDGFLTVDEMVQSRVPDFRCMDANHDGSVTKTEVGAAMARCAESGDAEGRIRGAIR
jgi:hypothetical protein